MTKRVSGSPGTTKCRICAWLCNWLCSDAALGREGFWARTTQWERDQSNEYELWLEDSERNRELNRQAAALESSDPEAALRLRLEAAEAGSVWAMEVVGWHYEAGTLVAADFGKAQEYYYRALSAGSWMATIRYARLLYDHGHFEHCEAVLQDGVRVDFAPSGFWLARYRHQQAPTRKTCRDVRPLLERAAAQGHPAAELLLARWTILGRFGMREIPEGFRKILRISSRPRPDLAEAVDRDGLPGRIAA